MAKKYFAPPIITLISEYLTRNKIPFKMGKKHSIVIPGYPVSGGTVAVAIFFDRKLNTLSFHAEADAPIPEAERDMIYEVLNHCNARVTPGRYFLCPDCHRFTYRLVLLLTTPALTDQQIASILESTVEAFLAEDEVIREGLGMGNTGSGNAAADGSSTAAK